MLPRLRHVGDAGKAATQFDDGGELTALDQCTADGIGGGFVNAEHARRVVRRPTLCNAGAQPVLAMSSRLPHAGDGGHSPTMTKS